MLEEKLAEARAERDIWRKEHKCLTEALLHHESAAAEAASTDQKLCLPEQEAERPWVAHELGDKKERTGGMLTKWREEIVQSLHGHHLYSHVYICMPIHMSICACLYASLYTGIAVLPSEPSQLVNVGTSSYVCVDMFMDM